jgi:hypothetical protein
MEANMRMVNTGEVPEPVPVLSDRDRVDLDLALAQWDNAELRVQLLQMAARELRANLDRRLQAAARPGYVLRRTEAGQWLYDTAGEIPRAG